MAKISPKKPEKEVISLRVSLDTVHEIDAKAASGRGGLFDIEVKVSLYFSLYRINNGLHSLTDANRKCSLVYCYKRHITAISGAGIIRIPPSPPDKKKNCPSGRFFFLSGMEGFEVYAPKG